MGESYDECPECKSDDLAVASVRDVRAPKRLRGTPPAGGKPVARTIWVRCRSCGWAEPVLRKVGEAGPAASPPATKGPPGTTDPAERKRGRRRAGH